jgi:hypothetical protein
VTEEDTGPEPEVPPGFDFGEWLTYGIAQGWCSDLVCETHDGMPLTDEESEEFEDGGDPCIPAFRVWVNGPPEATGRSVEALDPDLMVSRPLEEELRLRREPSG